MRSSKLQKFYMIAPAFLTGVLAVILTMTPSLALAAGGSFIGGLKNVKQIASTVPANGDQNPYGLVVVPNSVGKLVRGDLLVSNFKNNGSNGGLQGTGTTLVQISPDG